MHIKPKILFLKILINNIIFLVERLIVSLNNALSNRNFNLYYYLHKL